MGGNSNGRRDSSIKRTLTVGKTASQTMNAVLYLGAILAEPSVQSFAMIIAPELKSRIFLLRLIPRRYLFN
jgi:hypothetical protein